MLVEKILLMEFSRSTLEKVGLDVRDPLIQPVWVESTCSPPVRGLATDM